MDSTVIHSIQRRERPTQEPPNTCHLSILRNSRSFSTSFTRSQVVFSSVWAVLHGINIDIVITPLMLTEWTFQHLFDQIERSVERSEVECSKDVYEQKPCISGDWNIDDPRHQCLLQGRLELCNIELSRNWRNLMKLAVKENDYRGELGWEMKRLIKGTKCLNLDFHLCFLIFRNW